MGLSKSRSVASRACSAEANAKGLHGKVRRSYRKTCLSTKRGMTDKRGMMGQRSDKREAGMGLGVSAK